MSNVYNAAISLKRHGRGKCLVCGAGPDRITQNGAGEWQFDRDHNKPKG